MRNICLEKSYTKCGGETIPRSFSKKSELSISLNSCRFPCTVTWELLNLFLGAKTAEQYASKEN